MAIEFARTHIIGRSKNHTAVRAAAYRSGSDLFDEKLDKTVRYANRSDDVAHSEILLPEGADPALLDRQTLWAAAERAEDRHRRRASAQLAKDHIIALPRELTEAQQIALARAFALEAFVAHGVAVDLNLHRHSEGNPHAHLMTTTRFVGPAGFGAKARGLNGLFFGGRRLPSEEQLRHQWAAFQNQWMRAHGIDLVVTNNDGQWVAEAHRGPTVHMDGAVTDRGEAAAAAIEARQSLLVKDPEPLIERLAQKRSVFSRQDLLRELARHVVDHTLLAAAEQVALRGDALIRIGSADADGQQWFTTRSAVDREMRLMAVGQRLSRGERRLVVSARRIDRLLDQGFGFLSEAQRHGVAHLCGQDARLGIVVGLAGAGKSTMLDAARHVWEARGHRVIGLALAGIAAEGLQDAANISSRTVHSFLLALDRGTATLNRSDVVVLDEAGMVNMDLMLRLASRVESAGAKLVLVGDPAQLQPILAGNPLRAWADTHGYFELDTVRRQRAAWQRHATIELARGQVRQALRRYRDHGAMRELRTRADARNALVTSVIDDWRRGESRGLGVYAQANDDVQAINAGVRAGLVDAGLVRRGHRFRVSAKESAGADPAAQGVSAIGPGDTVIIGERASGRLPAGSLARVIGRRGRHWLVRGPDGQRERLHRDDVVLVEQYGLTPEAAAHPDNREKVLMRFGAGDRVLFERNDSRLDVRNGTLGTVVRSRPGHLTVALDSGRQVSVDVNAYDAISHGYASTVHKAQGATVARSKVLVTRGWDRHLAYVGLSRHQASVEIYYGAASFRRTSMESVLAQSRQQQNIMDFAASRGLQFEEGRFVRNDTVSPAPPTGHPEEQQTLVKQLERAQDALAAHERAKPGALKFLQTKTWEQERTRLRNRYREAISALNQWKKAHRQRRNLGRDVTDAAKAASIDASPNLGSAMQQSRSPGVEVPNVNSTQGLDRGVRRRGRR